LNTQQNIGGYCMKGLFTLPCLATVALGAFSRPIVRMTTPGV
jgi:hypothetical protein